MPEVWNTIRDYPWAPAPPAGDITSQLVAALNTHDPDQVVDLYTTNAVHITAARTVQGHPAIRAWYQSLFNDLLPNALFIRTSYSASNSAQHFTWTATSTNGTVDNGNDTIGVVDNKIAFHYSFFSISP
jgi:ketosteroid isomerase-like protein